MNKKIVTVIFLMLILACKNKEEKVVKDDQSGTLTEGLVFEYNFDPSKVYGNNGGFYKKGRAKINKTAIRFNGRTDYVKIKNNENINPKNEITITTWIKPKSFKGNGNSPIISKAFERHQNPYYQYHLGIVGNDETLKNKSAFTFYLTIDGILHNIKTPNNTWEPEKWYLLTGIFDGDIMKLFVNGKEKASKAIKGQLSIFDTDLYIAKYDNLGAHTPITIDELKIYNRALNKAEINQLFNN